MGRSNLTGRQFLIYAGQRLHPGLALYNSVYAINWPGLDPERFKLAWQTLVDSCDALRTVVDDVEGVPQQRVVAPFAAEVDCVRLPQCLEPERAIKDWINERLRRPLVLSKGYSIRPCFARQSTNTTGSCTFITSWSTAPRCRS